MSQSSSRSSRMNSRTSRLPTRSPGRSPSRSTGRSPTREPTRSRSRVPSATRTRTVREKYEPLCLYRAILTSLTASDESRERIYINPLDEEGRLRTDNVELNQWFDVSRNTSLRTRQYASDEEVPLIVLHPISGQLKFKVERVVPDARGNVTSRHVETITLENLIPILKYTFDSGFDMYTDYDKITSA